MKTDSVRLPEHIIPERYEIMLHPNLEKFIFRGEETIFLKLIKPTKEVILHADELEIDEAQITYGNQQIKPTKLKFDKKSETVIFSFPKTIPAGKGELFIKFRGILNDKMRGFYRSKYTVNGEEKYLATSQFESTDARRAFPCIDEPAKKAIFDITLMIPKKMVAISNTMPTDIAEHESGYQIVKFSPTPKMSTYLLAFLVGDFEWIEGRNHTRHSGLDPESRKKMLKQVQHDGSTLVRVFTTPGKKDQAKFALDVAIKCLEFYENYFKIAYPLPVLDMIAIPDFAAGAMENWGAVTYRESTLLVDQEKTSVGNKQWVALVIAHELAHQWFGNLVTMKWWTHLWLNEGFASFIEFLAIDHLFPDWDIWTQFVDSEMASALSLDALDNTHPIEVEVKSPAEISEIFDRVSYEKGASILRMLWKYLGESDFQKGLQIYLKTYAFGNAETADLWKALEEVSGKPVAKIMKNWTGKPGHPVIRVQVAGNRLQLTQSRFYSSAVSRRNSKDSTIWSIPLFVTLSKAKGIKQGSYSSPSAQNDRKMLMDKKAISIPNSGEKINTDEVSFVRVDYPPEYLKKLEDQIKAGKLSAPDRLGLIRDSFALAEAGESSTTKALELAQTLKEEENFTVWSELTSNLNKLDSLLAHESFYPDFRDFSREIYQGIGKKMGWEKKKGEKHTDVLLRGMVLYKLGSFGDQKTIKKAQELFSKQTERHPELVSGSSSKMLKQVQHDRSFNIDPDLRGVVLNLVAENGTQKEWDSLIALYQKEDNQQEKDRIGRSLGLFKDKTLLQKSLKFALSKDVRFQNSLGIVASVWMNPVGRYLAWEFVKINWELLKKRYAGGHYFTRVFGPMGEFTKKEDIKDIKNFVKTHPVPEAQRTLLQALEQIESNIDWLKRDSKLVEKFLKQVV